MISNSRSFILIALILLLATTANSAKLYRRVPNRLYHGSLSDRASPANSSLAARDTCTGCPAGTISCTATQCFGCDSGESPCPDGNGCCPTGVACVSNNQCATSCTGAYTICGSGCCDEGYSCDISDGLCINSGSTSPPPPVTDTNTIVFTSYSTSESESTNTLTEVISSSAVVSSMVESSAAPTSAAPSNTINTNVPSFSLGNSNDNTSTTSSSAAPPPLFKSAAMHVSAPSMAIAMVMISLAMLNMI